MTIPTVPPIPTPIPKFPPTPPPIRREVGMEEILRLLTRIEDLLDSITARP